MTHRKINRNKERCFEEHFVFSVCLEISPRAKKSFMDLLKEMYPDLEI